MRCRDETGEVDPVSEADVYIAYGRYQQAEELLRQALGRDPNRLALKHKLLEVHYATRNGDAFAALAQEMVDAGAGRRRRRCLVACPRHGTRTDAGSSAVRRA